MPYAHNGQISQAPIEGGIEITQEQYAEALAGMVEGKLVSIDGGFAVIDPPEPELPEIDPPTFEDLRAAKLQAINLSFTLNAAALTEGYPEAERLTWPLQQQEALAWAADGSTATPYLDGLAAARGIDPEEMRQKTLEQTQLFMVASQQLVGKRQRLRDLVYEAESPGDLDAIQWNESAAK